MESPTTIILLGVVIVFLGALLQTSKLFPSFFDSLFDQTASKLTISTILLLISVLILQTFLKGLQRWNREGFQDPSSMTKWKELTTTYPIADVCAMKSELEQRLFALEKGTADTLTDQQARERVEKIFTANTTNGTVNCQQFETVNKAKDIDTFFTVVQELPNTFLIQVQETAERILSLLEKQKKEVEKSLSEAKKAKAEGFIDPSVGICSPEITEERRKFLREKKLDEAAQRCLLPEEVPLEKKDDIAMAKVKKLQDTYDAFIRKGPKTRPLMIDIVTKAKETLGFLKEKQKQAEAGTIV